MMRPSRLACLLPSVLLLSGCLLGSDPLETNCTAAQVGPTMAVISQAALIERLIADRTRVLNFQPKLEPGEQLIADALAAQPAIRTQAPGSRGPAPTPVLLLSGGGQWGAYGAGFLQGVAKKTPQHFEIVTGVSTGALQALFAGIGDWDELARSYTIASQDELITKRTGLSILKRGAMYDQAPLLAKVIGELKRREPGKPMPIERLAARETGVFVGAVMLATGDFYIIDVAKLAHRLAPSDQKEGGWDAALRCVAGAAVASSSMPGFMRPTRFAGRMFVDGGARLSVFEMPPKLGRTYEYYVLRNGPTIMRANGQADAKPDLKVTATQAYGTIVNQNELTSIALLKLSRADPAIYYTSATAFVRANNFPPDPDVVFDKAYMDKLIEFGRTTGATQGWRPLSTAATASTL